MVTPLKFIFFFIMQLYFDFASLIFPSWNFKFSWLYLLYLLLSFLGNLGRGKRNGDKNKTLNYKDFFKGGRMQ